LPKIYTNNSLKDYYEALFIEKSLINSTIIAATSNHGGKSIWLPSYTDLNGTDSLKQQTQLTLEYPENFIS